MSLFMKEIKAIIGLSLLTVLFTVPVLLFAQTHEPATNTLPVIGDVTNDPIPTSKEDFWKWGIAFVVPVLVQGMKWLAPRIPSVVLPLTTPLLGFALGFLLNKLMGLNLGWVDMTQAGALGVFIRETWNQAITKRGSGESKS